MIRVTTNKGEVRCKSERYTVIRNGRFMEIFRPQVGDLMSIICGPDCTKQCDCPGIHELQVVVKVEEV